MMMKNMHLYDTIIIGGGPAGVAAAVYAGRKQLKTAFITEAIGGQSLVSDSIENWIGDLQVSGLQLAQKLEAHVKTQGEMVELKMPERAVELKKKDDGTFAVKTDKGEYETRTVIITAGGRHRHLGIPGEEKFNGKGVVYCSTCDAPLFRNRAVAVVGGGNSALEAVVDLFPYATKIYLMVRSDVLKGDPVTQEQVRKSEKVEIVFNVEPKEITGEMLVDGLVYLDKTSGEEKKLSLQGVFVEIGSIPNTEWLGDMLELNPAKEIVINHKNCETNVSGVFAAGDITDELYKQNNIAAGDGITALLSAYQYILKQKHGEK